MSHKCKSVIFQKSLSEASESISHTCKQVLMLPTVGTCNLTTYN